MRIIPLECKNSYRNINYLIADESTKECLCIDPFDAGQVAHLLKDYQLTLKAIINTHEHWDHIKGNRDLALMTKCEVWNGGEIDGTDKVLQDGEVIKFGKWDLKIVLTPGHTMKHISIYAHEGDRPVALFCGDTLFNAGVGNCHNGGHPETLYETFRDFFNSIPDHVMIYPGHDYVENNIGFAKTREPGNEDHDKILTKVTNAKGMGEVCFLEMREEREINPFLRLGNTLIQQQLPNPTNDEKQVFLQLRQLRNDW